MSRVGSLSFVLASLSLFACSGSGETVPTEDDGELAASGAARVTCDVMVGNNQPKTHRMTRTIGRTLIDVKGSYEGADYRFTLDPATRALELTLGASDEHITGRAVLRDSGQSAFIQAQNNVDGTKDTVLNCSIMGKPLASTAPRSITCTRRLIDNGQVVDSFGPKTFSLGTAGDFDGYHVDLWGGGGISVIRPALSLWVSPPSDPDASYDIGLGEALFVTPDRREYSIDPPKRPEATGARGGGSRFTNAPFVMTRAVSPATSIETTCTVN